MKISVITLFPDMFVGPFDASILKRAKRAKRVSIRYINPRDFATDRYKSVDDHPYGGGVGMILRVDVIDKAIRYAKSRFPKLDTRIILLDPQGTPYTQKKARALSTTSHLILVCGHYEGIDERIRTLIDEELSIGDYVLTGGEIPAMVVIDSVVRLLPGVLSKPEAATLESFEHALLEHPHYTRPETYRGKAVPRVLRSGNHAKIHAWRDLQSRLRTKKRRPDLLHQSSKLR